MQPLVLPRLHCPFQPAVSPYAAEVDQHTIAWATRFELISGQALEQRFRTARLGWLAAYLAPATPPEALRLLSDWNTWAIIWDDACDSPRLHSEPARLAGYHGLFLDILHGGEPARNAPPLVWALQDIRCRASEQAPAGRLYRFINHVEEFFAGCVWEATNRVQGQIPDVATYISMRRLTSGMYTSLKLVEIIDNIDLPLEVWKHPDVERLRLLATNAVCWANDIISLAKELQRGDTHNLVLILQRAQQLDLQDALDRVVALHDNEVLAFVAAERCLPSFGARVDLQVQRYVELLRSFMRGNLAWSAISGRYQPAPAASEATPLVVREECHVDARSL